MKEKILKLLATGVESDIRIAHELIQRYDNFWDEAPVYTGDTINWIIYHWLAKPGTKYTDIRWKAVKCCSVSDYKHYKHTCVVTELDEIIILSYAYNIYLIKKLINQ